MKIILIVILFALTTMQSFAQADIKQIEDLIAQNKNHITYRLFPTQNMWTFIKLNTRNGQMWQVQYGMKIENLLVTDLNSVALVSKDKEVNDKFTLYPTQNIYTFILIDQIDGKTWQVQWSIDTLNRAVIPIE